MKRLELVLALLAAALLSPASAAHRCRSLLQANRNRTAGMLIVHFSELKCLEILWVQSRFFFQSAGTSAH
jgi:hypothetical protein